jgi:thiol-disulfide isomerase/thioredoxin
LNRQITIKTLILAIPVWICLTLPGKVSAQPDNLYIIIHLRGVYDSKISLLGQKDSRLFKPIIEVNSESGQDPIRILVPGKYLPGEFVLRFDYREKKESTPYPSEKYLFINDQNLELWVHPMFCNNFDSTWFQKGERENTSYRQFSDENGKRKEKLAVLQNFLMNYDDTNSELYQQGIKEFNMRRQSYNQWLSEYSRKDKALFVSNMYGFEYVPEIPWNGTETDRIRSLIIHYFDGIDLNNPLLIKVSNLSKWMDNYVNLYGQLSTTVALRDSLFPEAGRNAIEKAKTGNPLVYGWMVDYFYTGYETNGINAGMKMLEPYLNDPECLTSKRMEIQKRLEGIETLVPGAQAPDISMKDVSGNDFGLYMLSVKSKYILILFWSAGCTHCKELVDHLYPWYKDPDVNKELSVVAVSLDDTETDITAWKQKTDSLPGWIHMGDPQGVRSKVAGDYFILSTPVMILIDGKTKKIVATPNTLEELKISLK